MPLSIEFFITFTVEVGKKQAATTAAAAAAAAELLA